MTSTARESGADVADEGAEQEWLAQVTQVWRGKVYWVTTALLGIVVGTLSLPLLLLEWIPGLHLVAVPAITAGIAAVTAILVGTLAPWIARLVIPELSAERARVDGSLASLAREYGGELRESLVGALGIRHDMVRFAELCAVVSKAPRSAVALLSTFGGTLYSLASGMLGTPAPMSVFAGAAIAALAFARAMWLQFPQVRRADSTPGQAVPPDDETGMEACGRDVLEGLKLSNVYRRQLVNELTMQGRRFAADSTGGAIERLTARFSALDQARLDACGIERLSDSQARALDRLLTALDDPTAPQDALFVGPPGSGRATLANLFALALLLHRESAVFCVSAERPSRRSQAGRARGRGPVDQFSEWVSHEEELRGRVQVAFADGPDARLSLGEGHDVFFTDVELFSEQFAAQAPTAARGVVQRLRLVIVDHPERLERNELLRLRLALAKLRLTAELLDRPLTFVVLSPALDSDTRLAKWLLNSDTGIEPTLFAPWYDELRVGIWQPPLEVADTSADRPVLERAPFERELQDTITEIVRISDQLHDQPELLVRLRRRWSPDPLPTRGPDEGERIRQRRIAVAIVDPGALLSPESMRRLHQQYLHAATERGASGANNHALDVDVSFIATADLCVRRERGYDVVVALGIGPHPEHLVSSLRPVLRESGVLILFSDESPDDLASIAIMQSPGWHRRVEHLSAGVERADRGELNVLEPPHSDALATWEFARFFDGMPSVMVPEQRLYEIFPARETARLVERWLGEGLLERAVAFAPGRHGAIVERCVYVRATPNAIKLEAFEIPWGCSTRKVLRVYDVSARRYGTVGRREVANRVDFDRLFIDLFPSALLHHPPSSLRVEAPGISEVEVDTGFRYRDVGVLNVEQTTKSDSIVAHRQLARFDIEIIDESPIERHAPIDLGVRRPRVTPQVAEPVELPALSGLFVLAGEPRDGDTRRLALARRYGPARLPGATMTASIGANEVRIRERLRDVLRTTSRLIHTARHTRAEIADFAALRSTVCREYSTVGVSVFIGDPTVAGPAVRGMARLLHRYLTRRWLRFDTEYSVDVVRAPATESHSEWRILVRGRRSTEIEQRNDVEVMLQREWEDFLLFASELLERCTCSDGCPACCGGLGSVTESELAELGDASLWDAERDTVSRRGALELVAGLRGVTPDWRRIERPPVGDQIDLQLLVNEIIGDAPTFTSGEWHSLFGSFMPLADIPVADARWMTDDELVESNVAGFYRDVGRGQQGQVLIRLGAPRDATLSTILHEYVHNWQFQHPHFDLEQHRRSDAVRPYFDGKLVIEGHARWAQQQLHLRRGQSPVHTVDDHASWDEYKVGYYLFEGIERAFGQYGLFLWLRYGVAYDASIHGVESPAPVSRDHRLPTFPFSLREALAAFGLTREAETGTFDGVDFEG